MSACEAGRLECHGTEDRSLKTPSERPKNEAQPQSSKRGATGLATRRPLRDSDLLALLALLGPTNRTSPTWLYQALLALLGLLVLPYL